MNSLLSIGRRAAFWCLLVWVASVAMVPTISDAQEKYPERAIEITIAAQAGGIVDGSGRIFGDELSQLLKVPVVPINRPGATGTTAAAFVLTTKKDGYTILAASGSAMVLARHLLPEVPYVTLRDFVPIAMIFNTPSHISTKTDSPIKSFEDLVDAAKKNPDKLTYGTIGIGCDHHFFMEQIQYAAKFRAKHVPYTGAGEIYAAVMGGNTSLVVGSIAGGAAYLQGGKIRALIVNAEKRLQSFPDIPLCSEKGISGHLVNSWVGLFAPAGTPEPVLNALFKASESVIKSKNFTSRIEKYGASGTTVPYYTPAAFKQFIEEDEKASAAIAKEIGLKPKK